MVGYCATLMTVNTAMHALTNCPACKVPLDLDAREPVCLVCGEPLVPVSVAA